MKRLQALLAKELMDLRANPGLFVPAVLTGLLSLMLPFFVAVFVPWLTGERLSDSSDFTLAIELYRTEFSTAPLSPEGAVQGWIFQQFLVLLVLAPIAGAMSVAAYTVIGEKQARTLEPLLATPLSTVELLGAKVLGALIPAAALTFGSFGLYFSGVLFLAEPQVYQVLLTARALSIVFVLGPLATLAALQLAVCVSSRVNDARSAQQIGALIILPLSGLLVAQLMGRVQLTPAWLTVAAVILLLVNIGLMRTAVVIFDRESILTRWK
ncbi:MAG: ABC transporter permease [Vicinamibacterales bacterium]